jgi:hypothetical protein
LHPDLEALFKHESAVIFMEGRKGHGKTDFSLRLGEDAYEKGFIKRIASNIRTEDERVDHITSFYAFKNWLLENKGRKYFVFDEAGKHLSKVRFMSQINKVILDIIQLIRHYDCTFTAISPSPDFIDSKYLGSEILDCRIKKIMKNNRHYAEVRNYLSYRVYVVKNVPRTSIKFWSKDIATFSLEDSVDIKKLSKYAKVAYLYGKGMTMNQIGEELRPKRHRMEVSRMIRKYLRIHFQEKRHVTSHN